jgi:poly(A)-specific ribonuclease
MDLTHHNFAYYLPWLLQELTQSYFVSIDFELSGIALPSSQAPKIQTLQERYLDTKFAAEKYQILQVGLTICNEDSKSGGCSDFHLCRPI